MEKNKKYWFGSKQYGYGWVPSSWQGWASIGVYAIVLIGATSWLSNQNDQPATTYNLLYTLMVLIATTVLYVVSKFKGPKPRWQWSKNNKQDS